MAHRLSRRELLKTSAGAGVVILAGQQSLIPSAEEVLRLVLEEGFRIELSIVRGALSRTVGEEWH